MNKTVSTTFVGSETTHNQNLTDACKQLSAKVGHTSGTISWTNNGSVGQCTRNGSAFGDWTRTIYTPKCPSPNVIIHVSFDDLEHVPLRVCTEIAPGKYCASVGNETTISGGGNYLGGYQRPSILHRSLSETPQNSCTPLFSDSPCDSKDPYGGCYVPPDDGCTRQKDGSIYCPPEAPPPQPDETCNGATYCKAPPQGCGEGYVRGSFNGQELCVKSGPSNPPKPDQPDDPENCANGGTYCPAPPNDDLCPDGYYPTTHNGSKICVKNNPNPNEPNPNDPNNNNGGDNGGDGETGGTGVDLSEIINAIKALRDALLQALGSISQKLSTLITGQKESNEHLDDIKKESIKTNQKLDEVNENITTTNSKLDTANDHLKNISDHSAAASEALGESNKKLDGIKDAVEGQYKCANESYDPNDKRSNKYRDCTEQDITGGSVEDTKVDIKEQTVNLENDLRRDLFGGNSTCPPPMVIEFTFINKVRLEYPYDLMCDGAALVRPWIILLGLLVSYFVVTGQRSGGQD
ncbi:hypothetical protein KTH36_05945 [Acinetobacter haemolyticus]|nr:hypothetical protein [Acinetobacter haemolyticus]